MVPADSAPDHRRRDWRGLAAGIELVATDLDGTLLRRDLSVSDYTVETLARARAAGLPVVFVTGRPPRWIRPVAEATGHRGLAVGANGAVVVDVETGAVQESHPLDQAALEETVRLLRAEVPGIGFAVHWVPDEPTAGTTDSFAYEPGFAPRGRTDSPPTDGDVREFSRGHRIIKLLARVPEGGHDADGLLAVALHHVDHLVNATHSNAGDVLLEMSAAGVSKASTLADVATRLGVAAANAAAAGDMPNDVAMIEWAGVGLAVDGAHRWVLEAADGVLPDPAQDGVAQFVAAVLDA